VQPTLAPSHYPETYHPLPPRPTSSQIYTLPFCLSVSYATSHSCITTFSKKQVIVRRDNQVILTGYWDPQTGLWRIPIGPLPTTAPPHLTPTESLKEAYELKHGKPFPRPFGFDMTKFHYANSTYQTKSNA
jgi:hypothetical protein